MDAMVETDSRWTVGSAAVYDQPHRSVDLPPGRQGRRPLHKQTDMGMRGGRNRMALLVIPFSFSRSLVIPASPPPSTPSSLRGGSDSWPGSIANGDGARRPITVASATMRTAATKTEDGARVG
uniref:Uncharacterized protein n=1 Tax=Plectus sambesii TaxID=2011161 RepID=A0A914X2N5_9BILA